MKRTTVLQVTENKNAPRIWIEGKWLSDAGFTPGSKFDIEYGKNRIIMKAGGSERAVSGKFGGKVSVIDLNSHRLTEALGCVNRIQARIEQNVICIIPSYTALLTLARRANDREFSLFSGGGFLSLAAKLAGFTPVGGIEINENYGNIFQSNHTEAHLFNASVEEVSWLSMREFRPLGLLTLGLPCNPFTNIRRLDIGGQQKRDKSLPPEAHELGDMTLWAFRAVEALNPHTIVIEEVPAYLDSGAGLMFINALKRWYKNVAARVLNPLEFGCLTGRKRAVIIASDQEIRWPEQSESRSELLGSILDPEPHEWFTEATKPWLFDHWKKQTAKGNGFASQIYSAESSHIGTIKKRYFAGQGDNPVIKHPTEPDTFRWLTLNEVKKLHGIPEQYLLSSSKTTSGEAIGQGVVVPMFQQIIQAQRII